MQSRLFVDEFPDARAVVARLSARALAQVKVLGEVGRHVLAAPAVDREAVFLEVALEQQIWNVAISDGGDLATVDLAAARLARKVPAIIGRASSFACMQFARCHLAWHAAIKWDGETLGTHMHGVIRLIA